MRRIAEQTLTSCLLARKICRHAQRKGRRKEERSYDKETKCERQEREGVWNAEHHAKTGDHANDNKDVRQKKDLVKYKT